MRLTGDIESARDVVQESWIEILRGLNRLRDDRAFPAWTYRIVTRRCARAIGTLSRARATEQALAAEAEPGAVEISTDASEVERLRAAIRALPPGQRAAIALFHFEELSVAEIAVALDVPAGTVKTRLMYARRKLRAALEGEA
ncbi:RNA polymerase sigma factor [Sphingomonas sp. MG17]|uniref:RNA polymerase sigma factor n=1 Tax=Sphingomonas tagetis TaxID=2949092 RepID=A0A9X2KN18_9SPHN|nr:RNA polymerase sigma factor [Sphingomonas tagetis]